MSEQAMSIKRPSFYWGLTEGYRALVELTSYFPYRVLSRIPKDGDGHPVLILPGFLSTDKSTIPLRSFVHNLGYAVYGWGSGRNLGELQMLDEMIKKVEHLFQEHGKKVSIIGWSLGGIFARQIAKARPNMVRQMITLGAPFKGVTQANNAKWIFDIISKNKSESALDQDFLEDIPYPAPVPTTAIYSKEDGIVPWRLCLEQMENNIHQNIQVRGSHLGLGVNPSVLIIIADRLKYKEENWKHFQPNGYIEEKFYPSLTTNDDDNTHLKIVK